MVHPVMEVAQAAMVNLDLKAHPAPLAQLAHLVNLVLLVQREKMVT
jgi:hypothetical protein